MTGAIKRIRILSVHTYHRLTDTEIKDLVVKGANFTAKRGTMVKNISLTSNPEHIEGRVNGTRIVLVSAFMKKA